MFSINVVDSRIHFSYYFVSCFKHLKKYKSDRSAGEQKIDSSFEYVHVCLNGIYR